MDEIVEFCEENNLLLIEDSAETIGGTWCGQQAGSWELVVSHFSYKEHHDRRRWAIFL